jgi:RNA polymerase sigma factor (sigma-70 family)
VVIQKLDTVKNPKAFLGWLKSITANYCTNKLRRKDTYLLPNEEQENFLDNIEDEDSKSVPEEFVDNTETQSMIMDLIKELPESQRECILMYYYEEMSVKDISIAVGVSEGTIKSRLSYARSAIKAGVKLYEEQGIKLYGSVMPVLGYVIKSSATAVTVPKTAGTILTIAKGAEILTTLPIDTAVLTTGAGALIGVTVGTTGSTVAGKIAIGAMATTLIVTSGLISLESQKNYNDLTATPDSVIATADEVKPKVKNNKKHSKATPDTASKHNNKYYKKVNSYTPNYKATYATENTEISEEPTTTFTGTETEETDTSEIETTTTVYEEKITETVVAETTIE